MVAVMLRHHSPPRPAATMGADFTVKAPIGPSHHVSEGSAHAWQILCANVGHQLLARDLEGLRPRHRAHGRMALEGDEKEGIMA